MFCRVYEKVNRDFRAALEQYIRSKRSGIPPALAPQLGGPVTAKGRELLTLLRDAFIAQNVALIRSILQQFHYRVQNLVWEAIRTGQSVGDNRVREKHRQLEGKIFSWGTGANGLYPGQDYQCRCWAEPVWEEIVAVEEPKPPRRKPARKVTTTPEAVPGLPTPEQIWQATDIETLLNYARQCGVEPTVYQKYPLSTYETALQTGNPDHVYEYGAMRAVVAALRDVVVRFGRLEDLLAQYARQRNEWPGGVKFEMYGNGYEIYSAIGAPAWGLARLTTLFHPGQNVKLELIKVLTNGSILRYDFQLLGVEWTPGVSAFAAQFGNVLGLNRVTKENIADVVARAAYFNALHEIGHIIQYIAMTREEVDKLQKLYEELAPQKIAVSEYALQNMYEFWAESFAVYMSPWANRQAFPQQIMKFVERVVKRLESAARRKQ